MKPIICSETLEKHQKKFKQYIEPYLGEGSALALNLKAEHTQKVLENALTLMDTVSPETWPERLPKDFVKDLPENLPEDTDLAQGRVFEILKTSVGLAALYHDIGRFEQYTQWQTFSDAHSFNHAWLGVREIRKHQLLNDVPCNIRKLVLPAIALHNRYVLPKRLSPVLRFVVNVVRDADKLDILRIMAGHFQTENPGDAITLYVRNDPEVWTEIVAEKFCRGEIIPYKDLRTVNDFRLLLLSWTHSFSFPEARARYLNSGHLETVLKDLPKSPQLNRVWTYIKTITA